MKNVNNEKIPKIIHYVWLGKGEKSEIVKKCIQSWRKNLCDYRIMEWNEENIDISTMCKYAQEAYKAKKWAFVSDYIRLKVLYEYGGIYLDTDMEVLANLNGFLKYDSFLGAESHHTICTAIIATKPHAKWIEELLNIYENMSFQNEDGFFNTYPNSKRLQEYLEKKYNYHWSNEIQTFDEELTIFPSEYFSPINCFTGKKNITNKTYTIHHYDNTWKSSKEKIKRRVLQIITCVIGEDIRFKIVNKKNRLKHNR